MTLYRTRTKTQFMWLMKYLEELGCEWRNGTSLLSSIKIFDAYKSDTIVRVDDENKITYADVNYYIVSKKYISEFYEVSEMEEYQEWTNTAEGYATTFRKLSKVIAVENDNINHPTHYTQGKYEAIDVILDMVEGYTPREAYLLGSAVKYLYRGPYKDNKTQDLGKAQFYINKLVEEQNK